MSFDPNITIIGDNRRRVDSLDLSTEDLLYSVLTELRILNVHMAKLTDEHIEKGDI